MKIGILTYHRSHNYGALLQAIALRHALAAVGNDVKFVDYWPEYHKCMYHVIDKYRLSDSGAIKGLKYLIKSILNAKRTSKRIGIFNSFIGKYITPHCAPTDEDFDMVIYGSDQIWRRQARLGGKYNPVYFAKNDFKTKKHVSYAASMGIIDTKPEEESLLKDWFANFNKISVREESLKNKLQQIGIENVQTVIDPTLLLTKEQWLEIINTEPVIEGKYILFYDLMANSFDLEAIKKYAADKNLQLIILKASVDNLKEQPDIITDADPEGMISLIANAEHVFTSSYHGLVFSLIFNKPVTAAFATNRERAESILSKLECPEVLTPAMATTLTPAALDYTKINTKLKDLRKSSQNFLAEALKK